MDIRAIYRVRCETKVQRLKFEQYVRADSDASALYKASAQDVRALSAEPVMPDEDWLLESVNRSRREVVVANDRLTSLRESQIVAEPVWTVAKGVIVGVFVLGLVSLIGFVVIASVLGLR